MCLQMPYAFSGKGTEIMAKVNILFRMTQEQIDLTDNAISKNCHCALCRSLIDFLDNRAILASPHTYKAALHIIGKFELMVICVKCFTEIKKTFDRLIKKKPKP